MAESETYVYIDDFASVFWKETFGSALLANILCHIPIIRKLGWKHSN